MNRIRITPYGSGTEYYQIEYKRSGLFSFWRQLRHAYEDHWTPVLFKEFEKAHDLAMSIRNCATLDNYEWQEAEKIKQFQDKQKAEGPRQKLPVQLFEA